MTAVPVSTQPQTAEQLEIALGNDLLNVLKDVLTHDNFSALDDGTKALLHTVALAKIEMPVAIKHMKDFVASIKAKLDAHKAKPAVKSVAKQQ